MSTSFTTGLELLGSLMSKKLVSLLPFVCNADPLC